MGGGKETLGLGAAPPGDCARPGWPWELGTGELSESGTRGRRRLCIEAGWTIRDLTVLGCARGRLPGDR